MGRSLFLVPVVAISLALSCSRAPTRSASTSSASAPPTAAASPGGAAGSVCFRVSKNPIEAGQAPEVVFAQPLRPAPGESYWITAVPEGKPDAEGGRWKMLEPGATGATLEALRYAFKWEIRLHDGYPRLKHHVVCRRTISVENASSRRAGPTDLMELGQTDADAKASFAAAVPAGSVDPSMPPRRWELRHSKATTALILGRYQVGGDKKLALVALGIDEKAVGHRVDLPGTEGVRSVRWLDLAADPARAEIALARDADAGAPALVVPEGASYPALLMVTETAGAKGARTELVAVELRGPRPRVVLTFPLSSSGSGGSSFSTIGGPDLKKSDRELLDIVVRQHALPSSAQGRPGPPTTFVCRFGGDRYECGR